MTAENIKDTLNRLEHLMYGHNYEVSFGIDIFADCTSLDEFQKKLQQKYSKVKPEKANPVSIDTTDFWEHIDFGLTYRGDNGAGLKLTQQKEDELLIEQTTFKNYIKSFLSDKTKIYSYPEELGVGYCAIFWGYILLLLNDDGPSLLVYGSASD